VRPLPQTYPATAWLPASSVSLQDSVTEGPLTEGEPLTRVMRLTAKGLSPGQLPEIPLPESQDMKAYPDRPVLTNQADENGLVGIREQRIAYIPTSSGQLVLPELRIPWWNTEKNQLEYALLPERVLQIRPAAQSRDATNVPGNDANLTGTDAADTNSPIWKITTLLAALGWMLTVMAWLISRNKASQSMITPTPQAAASPRALQQALQSACHAGNPESARKALVDYLQQRFPTASIAQAVMEIERIAPGIEAEVQKLDRNLYGPGAPSRESSWQGKDLWQLISQSMDAMKPQPHSDGLVALYPGDDTRG